MISRPAGSELPRSEIDDDGRDGTFRGIFFFVLGFLRRGVLMGKGWAPGARWGPHTIARRSPTLGRALLWCRALGAPPQVPSGLRKLPELLFMAEKISSDSEDILHVDISETKNSRKHGTGTLASC